VFDPNHLASKSGAEDRPHVLPSVKIEAVRQGSTNEDVSLNLCRGSKRRSRQTEDAESEQGQIPVRSSVLLDQRKCRNGRNKPRWWKSYTESRHQEDLGWYRNRSA